MSIPSDRLPDAPVTTDFAIAEIGKDRDNPSLVTLYLDGAESSALDLNDPHHLEFEYMQHTRVIVDSIYEAQSPLRILHLGGAGCALARAFDADRPGSRQLVIEIDRTLASLVRQWFDLPSAPRLRIRADEARRALDTTQAHWDVVIRDAFVDRDVPAQLRTSESASRAHDVLTEGGIYILNAIASTGLDRFGEEVATLHQFFPHLVAIVDPAIIRGRRFGNIVIAASDEPFDEADISRAVRRLPLPATVIGESALLKRALGAKPLSDATIDQRLLWSRHAHNADATSPSTQ